MTLRLLTAGFCSLIADQGRPATRSLGVPVGGAADQWSLAVGNGLVGNPPDTAGLEITLAGPIVQADCQLACVIYGAPFPASSDRQQLVTGKTFVLTEGEVLRIGSTRAGLRAYLCVQGGLLDRTILNSQSSLEPLPAGAALRCFPGSIGHRFLREAWRWNRDPLVLRAMAGAQADWFPIEEFYQQEFKVTEMSNRMGLRLQAQPLSGENRELVSEPVAPGAVQVTSDRQCIVLGVDGQTIGGYPKIAHVISADLDKLGQLRPGDRIRFSRVTLDDAEIIYRQKQAEWKEWTTRLRITRLSEATEPIQKQQVQ
jgi:allophanate hydrolase subunit 2